MTDQHVARDQAGPLALYVTGPAGGKRYLLRLGQLVTVGRAVHSTIVIDDPRVSRSHAALHLTDPMGVSDLHSANGTFVGRERLQRGVTRKLELDQTFFVGDSALVVRPSGLVAPATDQIIAVEALTARWRATGADRQGAVILRVRVSTAVEPTWVQALIADFLSSPRDWILPLGAGETAAGILSRLAADVSRLERAVLARFASWGLTATVEAAFVSEAGAETAPQAALAFLRGGGAVTVLERGSVILRAPAMQALRRTLVRVAPAPVGILILGETGAGKDVVASMIHELSPRAARPLVRLNCASLPEHLLESELFGHERGAFTGAVAATPGLLEAADGGTVFLDEIGDLALSLQPKLLRAIESSEVLRVGGVRPRKIDVRFVAATNHDLERAVAAGRFRRDLLHRLNCVTVTVPPLRERREEIAPLARHFLDSACSRFGLGPLRLSAECVVALEAYCWPGNVRELRNVIERAALLTNHPFIDCAQLALPEGTACLAPAPRTVEDPISPERLAKEDGAGPNRDARASIAEALAKCAGNQSRAAELLGIPRRTLVRRLTRLGLPRPRRKVNR